MTQKIFNIVFSCQFFSSTSILTQPFNFPIIVALKLKYETLLMLIVSVELFTGYAKISDLLLVDTNMASIGAKVSALPFYFVLFKVTWHKCTLSNQGLGVYSMYTEDALVYKEFDTNIIWIEYWIVHIFTDKIVLCVLSSKTQNAFEALSI